MHMQLMVLIRHWCGKELIMKSTSISPDIESEFIRSQLSNSAKELWFDMFENGWTDPSFSRRQTTLLKKQLT